MKLRSIALASLLGAGLVMSTGCSDAIKDAINDAVKTNVITIANANDNPAFYIDNELKEVGQNSSRMFVVADNDTYAVRSDATSFEASFPKDGSYLYAQCKMITGGENGVMLDAGTGTRNIQVFNLSAEAIGNAETPVNITLYGADGIEGIPLATARITDPNNDNAEMTKLDSCYKADVTFENDFKLVDVKVVKVGDTIINVPAYDQDIADAIDALDHLDFDVVIFNAMEGEEQGTIVPLATATDLVQ